MKARYRLFRRVKTFYFEDSETGKQGTLRTKDPTEAHRLLAAKNESQNQPRLNMQLARTYLLGADPRISTRTWADVMVEAGRLKQGNSLSRWQGAMQQEPFDTIRDLPLFDTRAEHFIHMLNTGTVSTNVFGRCCRIS
jgi:hypothetical protein